jgi:hypothetical protein
MAFLMLLRRMKRAGLTARSLRSTVRDRTAEETSFLRGLAEQALAHSLEDGSKPRFDAGISSRNGQS